jgi:perosamine synthetase
MSAFEIPLSDPDLTQLELDAVIDLLKSTRISSGPVVEAFEATFATCLGRRHAIAVASGTAGLWLLLRACEIGPGDEVVASAFGWQPLAHAIALSGARPLFADVDYWSGTMSPEKAAAAITPASRALLVGNSNGHPADWDAFTRLAQQHRLLLIEDSSEAIGSRRGGRLVGSFGACALFDFSQPGALVCGEGGMVVTDDSALAARLRTLRSRHPADRHSVVSAGLPCAQLAMSDLTAALGLAQLSRLPAILERRRQVEAFYREQILSFEGIKPPYQAPDVEEVHWFLYLVHLGTRFSRSSRDAIVDDLHTEAIEAYPYCQPLHRQRAYLPAGTAVSRLPVTEKLADRALALPFHAHLDEEQVAFIVATLKDASINVGAGTTIYL